MWLLYQIAITLALVVIGPILLLRRGLHYLQSLAGRLGGYAGPIPDSPLWIHAVSVGEVAVATTLARALPESLPLLLTTVTPTGQLLLTTVTPTGQARALNTFAGRAAVAYLPFELGFAIKRFLNRFRPQGLVLVEGDLWPLLLARVKGRGLPVAVVNGRVSDHSFRRMQRLQRLLGPIFGPVDGFAMQSEEDRQRLLALGVAPERVVVTGNLKFDTPPPKPKPELEAAIHRLAAGRPVILAGSTMDDEEPAVLEAFERIGGGDQALLVLAPRHPERFNDVERLIRERGLQWQRRSQLDDAASRTDVLLLDSLGELAAIYAVGIGCFIGGTMVPTGGHNPLEAALHGVAIAVGPSMENFREIAAAFDSARAWRRVTTAEDLARAWHDWLSDPAGAAELGARGVGVLNSNQGALDQTTEFLQPIFDSLSRPEPTNE
jgi:3-deoxy-D-manno-octulosonic-acid transferase